MKATISAKRTEALDEDDLRQLNDLSFTRVIAEIAQAEPRAHKEPKRGRPEIDLESSHTDRTINELLTSDFSSTNQSCKPEPSVLSRGAMEPEANDATEDLIAPEAVFPELTLKR